MIGGEQADGPERFLPVDALRGLAAVMVLAFHLLRMPPQAEILDGVLPAPLTVASDYARSGVAIFFVISGFVIGYTTRHLGSGLSEGARFSLRRQIRLDPPYYLVIALVIGVELAQSMVPSLEARTFTISDALLNMFYLQDIAGAPSIVQVAWTLCLEVQFYLFVVVLVMASGAVRPGSSKGSQSSVVVAAGLAAGAFSMAMPFLGLSSGAWFIGAWWMFCLGMITAWLQTGRLGLRAATSLVAVVGVWCVSLTLAGRADPWGGHWMAWLTGLLILALVATNRMGWKPPRWLLYLGTISYSLYLIHVPLINTFMAGVYKLGGESQSIALLSYVLCGILAIVAAALMRRWVEEPAIRWSRRVRPDGTTPRAARATALDGDPPLS
jgi:hypothetical protein